VLAKRILEYYIHYEASTYL